MLKILKNGQSFKLLEKCRPKDFNCLKAGGIYTIDIDSESFLKFKDSDNEVVLSLIFGEVESNTTAPYSTSVSYDALAKTIPLGLVGIHNTILNFANAITGSGTTNCTSGELFGFSFIFPIMLIFSGIMGYNNGNKSKLLLCCLSIFAYGTYLFTAHAQPLTCWIIKSGLTIDEKNLGVAQTTILVGLGFIIGYLYTFYYQKKRK